MPGRHIEWARSSDIRDRIGIPGIWYSGSHGFEIIGPDGKHRRNDAAAAAVSSSKVPRPNCARISTLFQV